MNPSTHTTHMAGMFYTRSLGSDASRQDSQEAIFKQKGSNSQVAVVIH